MRPELSAYRGTLSAGAARGFGWTPGGAGGDVLRASAAGGRHHPGSPADQPETVGNKRQRLAVFVFTSCVVCFDL